MALLKKINPADWAFIAYQVVVGLLLVIFRNNFYPWENFAVRHVEAIIAALLVIRFWDQAKSPVLRMIRHWYPILTFVFFYEEVGNLNQLIFQGFWDPVFVRWDLAVFGVDTNIWMYDHWYTLWTGELFHLCYFSYYVLPALFGLILYFQKDVNYFRILFGFVITFYVCYLAYIFIPVQGPLEGRAGRFDGPIFIPLMEMIYAHAEKPGAAFPSSHVAIAVLTLLYTWRYRKSLFWWFLPFITGLVLATVFCFYHYAVDVVAGLAVSAAGFYGCEWWIDKYLKKYFPDRII